jgi:flavin-dependent dehydrogenase
MTRDVTALPPASVFQGTTAGKPSLLERDQRNATVIAVSSSTYDVAIIGGGPAGSTAAALLARAGRRVVVFEREKFPRFHIGESLLPFSMNAFTRLGLHEKFASAGFIKKYGGEIMGACSDTGTKFYFKDGYRSQTDHAYQVTRGDFDKVLLDHAAESGAEVHEQTLVSNVIFRDSEVTLSYKSVRSDQVGSARCADRTSQRDVPTEGEIRARYLVDASGRTSVLGRQFKIKKTYDHLQKLSIFAHYDGVWRPEGIDGTLTVLIRAVDRWFWLIPLSDERTSVGVVLDSETFRKSKLSADDFLEQALAEQPTIAKRMTNARRVSKTYVEADFSYRSARLYGDRWLLTGDAAGFIDPIFSSGVFLAVFSGEKCADTLNEVLDHPRKAKRLFARYERSVNRAMDVYLRFVNAWYTKEFIEVFLAPRNVLGLAPAVNAVLGGNVGNSFPIRWRMWVFYFLVWLQRHHPIAPKLTLMPKKEQRSSPLENVHMAT